MKKSLGRRSSSRNPTRVLFTDFESARKDRRSGIPVRATSIDRNLNSLATPRNRTMMTPCTKRSASEDRNSMIFSAKCWTGGVERPSRATTLSTSSARHSSYGGARSKRDNRPIEDRDWQIETQRKVENFLIEDEDGCHIISNGSIRPMTLKLFIAIVDLLLKKLFGNYEKTYINKENYIIEFPCYMKKLFYRGKVEKSWLISVNTTRSWCHVLASFDFLVTCINSQLVIDPEALLFPEKYEEDDDFWNYQILLPYLQKSYELYGMNDPNYEAIQEQMDRKLIEQHVSNENAQEKIKSLESDIEKFRKDAEGIAKRLEKCSSALTQLDQRFNNLKENKAECEEYLDEITKCIEDLKVKSENKEKHLQKLMEELNRQQLLKQELKKDVVNQKVSHIQVAELKKKRDSLEREIEIEQEYVAMFEDLIRKNSIEILSQKKEIQNTLKTYNMEIIKYFSYGLESAMIDVKQSEEEINQAVEKTANTINAAKLELQTLSASSANESLSKAREELKLCENQVSEKKNALDKLIKDNHNTYEEAEKLVVSLKSQLDTVVNKINGISMDRFQDTLAVINEKKIRADKMEKQLSQCRVNAVYITMECTKLIEEYSYKHKELVESVEKKLEDLKNKMEK